MTISATPIVREECLTIRGKVVFTRVPGNVVISPATGGSAFIGAKSENKSSRHVFTLGVLQGYKLLCLFRIKIWWMVPHVGNSGSDIPVETQMLLLEAREGSAFDEENVDSTAQNTFYILLLPVLDGDFRTSLQGSPNDEVQFCVESGDPGVETNQTLEAVFVNSGYNPFELIKDSIKIVAKRKRTFSHIENKKIPPNLDCFGWCTWDAFYTEVDPQGIKNGLESFSAGGCPPRFLIIDDGWQTTMNEFRDENGQIVGDAVFATRLADIKENEKFQGNGSSNSGLSDLINTIKKQHGVKYVYMWHALAGYWGGADPTSDAMKKYNPKIVYSVQSPGITGNIRDVVPDGLEKYGVGVIDPSKIHEFYDDLHRHLANSGVDGVKVDVQNLIETLGLGYGGRVSLARKYHQGLEESIERNFSDNSIICCMSHNSDNIYSSKKSAVARASEDFLPRKPTFQTLHIASVSFNSLLLGEIFVPDWDMFQSKHLTAEFHGAARAIGGCGVYVSDKPGEHDFKILKKLVLSDGSVLRARYAGRPTRDCLFKDPVTDGKSLLKIWNLNKHCGVVGVFNCQGAGKWLSKENPEGEWIPSTKSEPITGHVSPLDVEFFDEFAGDNWTGDCAVFSFNTGHLSRVEEKESVPLTLDTLQFEIYTISPVKEYGFQKVQFAPIGLIEMYNSGGAVETLDYCTNDSSQCIIKIKTKGCGKFGAYSSIQPKYFTVDGEKQEFTYTSEEHLLTLYLPTPHSKENILREISVVY